VIPLKERVLNFIRRPGPDGIAGDELFAIAYDDQLPRYCGGHKGRGETCARSARKANIHQLNKLLGPTGYRIVGSGCRGGHYRLQKFVADTQRIVVHRDKEWVEIHRNGRIEHHLKNEGRVRDQWIDRAHVARYWPQILAELDAAIAALRPEDNN
jgi:hypothetical protein